VTLWDAVTGEGRATIKTSSRVVFLAFSPSSKALAVIGHNENTVDVWDVSTKKVLHRLKGHEKFVKSVAFSPDGTRLATTSLDETARLWSASTGKPLATLRGHDGVVKHVAFGVNGGTLALAGGRDKTVSLWDVETGKRQATLEGHTQGVSTSASRGAGRADPARSRRGGTGTCRRRLAVNAFPARPLPRPRRCFRVRPPLCRR
jgi:WD40 repeat protein